MPVLVVKSPQVGGPQVLGFTCSCPLPVRPTSPAFKDCVTATGGAGRSGCPQEAPLWPVGSNVGVWVGGGLRGSDPGSCRPDLPHWGQAFLRGCFCTARAQRPIVSWLAHDHPANHPPPAELRPEGKNSRFRQQSGIFSGKYSLFFNSLPEFLD